MNRAQPSPALKPSPAAAQLRPTDEMPVGLGELAESVRRVYAGTCFAELHAGQILREPEGLHARFAYERARRGEIVAGQGPKGRADILFEVRAGSAATNLTEQ